MIQRRPLLKRRFSKGIALFLTFEYFSGLLIQPFNEFPHGIDPARDTLAVHLGQIDLRKPLADLFSKGSDFSRRGFDIILF
jgi:hypothetical protein